MGGNPATITLERGKPKLLEAVLRGDLTETRDLIELNCELLTSRFTSNHNIFFIAAKELLRVQDKIVDKAIDNKRDRDLEAEYHRRFSVYKFISDEMIKRRLLAGGYC